MASITSDLTAAEPTPHLGSVLSYIEGVDHSATVRLRGALCAITAVGHAEELGDLVDRGFIELRIDLDELLLCTSDGLDCWDELQHRLDGLEGRLTLSGAHGVVRRVLDIVTLNDEHFCPTVLPAA